jgi:hypothetical protein
VAQTGTIPDSDIVWTWFDQVRDRLGDVSGRHGLALRDFATTAVCCISNGNETLTAHVGDGAVVARRADSLLWSALSWPDAGEFASSTFFVTDEILLKLRISNCHKPVDSLALFTDGIERLALNFAESSAHQPFFSGMITPLHTDRSNSGHLKGLSRLLYEFLGSERVNNRTDDDKTLLIAAV